MSKIEIKPRIRVSAGGTISVRASDILASAAGKAQMARVAGLKVARRDASSQTFVRTREAGKS